VRHGVIERTAGSPSSPNGTDSGTLKRLPARRQARRTTSTLQISKGWLDVVRLQHVLGADLD